MKIKKDDTKEINDSKEEKEIKEEQEVNKILLKF
jgi:serine/threonine protein kinase